MSEGELRLRVALAELIEMGKMSANSKYHEAMILRALADADVETQDLWRQLIAQDTA